MTPERPAGAPFAPASRAEPGGHSAAFALAERIAAFWQARGLTIQMQVVRDYGEWNVRSTLTGRELCEPIVVKNPHKPGAPL